MSMTYGQWLLKPLISAASVRFSNSSSHSYLFTVSVVKPFTKETPTQVSAANMATSSGADNKTNSTKVIDSHLHVWASPEEAAGKYPYFPGQEPTLRGDLDFLLQSLEEAGVDGALIVQPINHKFDHSLVTSVLKKYPNKFVGCCLANPAADGSGLKHLEELILKDGYRAVRFNPYLWPSGQKMTNDIGKRLFSKAGELGVPVGFMCMKGLDLHISEIQELCTEFPSTVVLLDHLSFCKPPTNDEESFAFSELLKLSKFPQGVKNAIPISGSGPPPLPSCFELWCEPSHVGQVEKKQYYPSPIKYLYHHPSWSGSWVKQWCNSSRANGFHELLQKMITSAMQITTENGLIVWKVIDKCLPYPFTHANV